MAVVQIKYEYDKAMGLTKTEFNRIAKEAYFKVGMLWKRKMLPRHFEPRKQKIYQYKLRSINYRKVRADKAREERGESGADLVWSGESRRTSKTGNVIANSKGVRITVPARVLNFRPHMTREVTAVTAQEMEALSKEFVAHMDRELQDLANRKQRG